MADKTVVVRLKAVVDDYQTAMRKAAESTDTVGKAGGKLAALAPNMKRLGDTLSIGVTLPLAAAGAGALKLSNDFDLTFSRMVGLAGVGADQVGQLKDSVLSLAGETARAPQDLAEGLYFIESAGLSGKAALDALKVSAKAASAGLGDTATVADAVTSAINAYGSANITAAQAGDVLAATVRDGKAEAAALAPQFGRLLPVAAQLGISFDQVGAGMAFLSRSSGDAALSASQMSALMNGLLRPTQQSAKALEAVGMSFAGIQLELKQKGLLATLTDMRARLGDSGFVQFFQDVNGLQAALQLTGTQAKEAKQVFDDLAHSTGSLDNAFGAFADSAGFKQKQAFAEVQVAIIKIGDAIAPLVAQLAGFASSIAGTFAGLPTPVIDLAVAFGGLLAAVGPIMSIVGRVKTLQTALEGMGRGGQIASSGLGTLAQVGAVGGGVYAAASAVDSLIDSLANKRGANIGELGQALLDLQKNGQIGGEAARILGSNLGDLKNAIGNVADPSTLQSVDHLMSTISKDPVTHGIASWFGDSNSLDDAKKTLDALDQSLTSIASQSPAAAKEVLDALGGQGIDTAKLVELLPKYRDALASADTQQKLTAGSGDKNAAALAEQQANADKAAKAIQAYADQLHAAMDPLFGMLDAIRNNNQANVDAAVALRDHGAASQEYADAAEKAAKSALDMQGAAVALAGAVAAGSVSVDDAIATFQAWADQGLVTQATANHMADALRNAGTVADGLQGKNVTMFLGLDSTVFKNALADAQTRLNQLGASWQLFAGTFGIPVGNTRRWGGIDYMAAGGTHTAGIATRPTLFGEHATGGEAYIPRLGDRQRSLGILQTAAGWYGKSLTADGGTASASRAEGGVTMVDQRSISIAISPGVFNKSEVYDQVSRALYGFHNQHGWESLERQLAAVRR